MSDDQPITRRKLLAATGTLAATSLAGCSEANTGENNEDVQQNTTGRKVIRLPQEYDLELFDTISITGEQAHFTWYANILLYSDPAVSEKVKEYTLGQFDQEPMRLVGTIFIGIDGFGSGIAADFADALNVIEPKIEEEFRKELENFGVENVSQTGSGSFDGELILPEFTIDSFETPGETEEITFTPEPVEIDAGYDLDKTDDTFKGGLYIQPENYSTELDTISISSKVGEGIDVDPTLNLPFDKYFTLTAEELQEVVEETEPETV